MIQIRSNNTLRQLTYVALAVIGTSSMSSCVVGKKKYDALMAQKNACDSTLNDLSKKHQDLNAKFNASTKQANSLMSDTAKLGRDLRRTRGELATAEGNYSALMSKSSSEAANLLKNLQATQQKNEQLARDLEQREARVKELEKVISDKEKAVRALRDKVMRSLLGFNEKDLSVQVKNGKVYVSLSEQLLFQSGRYEVDPKGKEALEKLGDVLKRDTTITVMIEGHTDDVPLRAGTMGMKDNWDLSVLRATSIARILGDAGVEGSKMIASGRSKYLPLDAAKNAEARTKNRRTEIILTPKLDELFKILEN